VLDELPWAIEADGAMLSALQYAWDIHFQHSNLILVLCGSQIRTMETILSQQTPLFGRLTAQYRLQPFPFEILRQFFPSWSPEVQVAVYAMVGGVPAYLSWFSADHPLSDNIRQSILAPASVALSEIELLLSDEVRDIRTYLTVLNAIGEGAHALKHLSSFAEGQQNTPGRLGRTRRRRPGRAGTDHPEARRDQRSQRSLCP
jgi:AAA+ ATPase superfamily predicted ATPase